MPTYRKIFLFWAPLAATWLMMAVEGPFLTAIIARLAEPKFNLAAFGVAFAFGLILEAPVIMIMTASLSLVNDFATYLRVRQFIFVLNFVITGLMLILVIPPVFYWIAGDLMRLPGPIAHLSHIATVILLPWPAAIGYRRFYQGILIGYNRTRRVAYGTIIRLTTMATTTCVLYWVTPLPGVYTATIALSAGVVIEALASRVMADDILRKLRVEAASTAYHEPPGFTEIIRFYYPLAFSSLLALGISPIVNFFLGHSRMSIESLAVLPVINSLNFIFGSLGLSYQEVALAQLGKQNRNYPVIRNYAWMLTIAIEVCISILAFSPLAEIWFHRISGLSPALTRLSIIPFRITVLLPGLWVLMSVQRAVLINGHRNIHITNASAIEVLHIAASLFIGIRFFDAIGIIAATVAYLVGRICANAYMVGPVSRLLRPRPGDASA